MQTLHTPALHKLLGTPVTLDLGSTAHDIIVTRDLVTELPAEMVEALKPSQEIIAQLPAQVSSESDRVVSALAKTQTDTVAAAVTTLKASVAEEVRKVLDKLAALPAPVPPSAPASVVVNDKSAPLLRHLAQVLTLAVDARPGQTYAGKDPQFKGEWGENVALHELRKEAEAEAQVLDGAPLLKRRFLDAFAKFTATDLPSRSQRFGEVHALITAITHHLG